MKGKKKNINQNNKNHKPMCMLSHLHKYNNMQPIETTFPNLAEFQFHQVRANTPTNNQQP